METIITNARIVTGNDEFVGTARIEDGIIADLDSKNSNLGNTIDFEREYLLPGLVDVHTDHLERQIMPRVGVFWNAVNAAVTHDAVLASAGTTTVFDSLIVGAVGNPDRRKLLPLMLSGLYDARQAGLLKVEHLLHLRCDAREDDLIDLIAPYIDDPQLRFVTIMDDSARRDPDRFRRLERSRGKPHTEIEAAIAAVPTTTDCTVENRRRLVDLCKCSNVPPASHDDTTAEHIAEGEAFGLRISEFPITLESARAARAAKMKTIIGAPNIVAGRSHIGNVSGMLLAEEDLIDVISSDYIPTSLLHAVWRLGFGPKGPGLVDAVAMASKQPAELFGLFDRGELSVGRRADMLRVAEVKGSPVVRSVWVAGGKIL
ncbi:alpha-D-ribose 1-methylphosphonate 5-triphosphate diphosphatase [Phyllobacterium sophorae]|uniref:Alpha-D-ribose 1-methylphosphonate 5-triphosphate diphosphatase n=1 Tax=Phyllobacterium sophorae TaxID=1520277 RepID=A0A2P7B332_9HYPH|nr:alpha-D-ribose 1-methylphosphonate 5-triphosphate diphosphatase [Phyllobacterium sophorae]PSH60872.1 alpha-D-ribose 1-methylphosphonate 5-triphosphate diphosphatase [Phyllobacterium sophorae]